MVCILGSKIQALAPTLPGLQPMRGCLLTLQAPVAAASCGEERGQGGRRGGGPEPVLGVQ